MSKLVFERDFSRHPLHYFVLLCVLLIGLWGIMWFTYDPASQFVIFVAMASSYVVWGVVHHYFHRDLHPRIIAEYVLIALLAVLFFVSLILRP